MKILLTGGTGFVGRALVMRLVHDHDVFCLVRNPALLSSHPRLHVLVQDLSQPLVLSQLPATMDAVIHVAQSRNFRRFPDQAIDIYQVNTHTTMQLLEYGRLAKVQTFVLASSGGVCGYQAKPILEQDPPNLMNFYLASKYAAECLVNAYTEQFKVMNLRYFFVYGEGQRDMFMPSLTMRVIQGQPVTIAGKSGVMMNPVHVSDAVEATVRALELDRSDTINVAGPDITSVFELAELIGTLSGRKPVYSYEADKGTLAMIANIEKMKLRLGFTPAVGLRDGVGRLVRELMQGT